LQREGRKNAFDDHCCGHFSCRRPFTSKYNRAIIADYLKKNYGG
jgi:hypothetical protein